MYAIVALALALAFALVTVAVPLRFEALFAGLSRRLWRTVIYASNQAVFHTNEDAARQTAHLVRLFLILSAVVFALLGIVDGAMIRNNPDSIARVVSYCVLASAVSGFLVLSLVAYGHVVPGFRAYTALRRCGFRGLWLLAPSRVPQHLAADLRRQAETSTRIGVIDVTGHGLFVEDNGSTMSLLREVIESTPDVPVSVLLLNPQTSEIDPDRRQVSVFQSVLSEMGVQSGTYMKRLRKTLEVIGRLNEERPPEAQIEVKFYNEKPTLRAVIFDASMIVFPWGSQAAAAALPCLEVAKDSEAPSFYETFRRTFARLWKNGLVQVFATRA